MSLLFCTPSAFPEYLSPFLDQQSPTYVQDSPQIPIPHRLPNHPPPAASSYPISVLTALYSYFYNSTCRVCWRRQWHPTPVPSPGKSHGRRSLVGCRPWGRYESNTTERLHFHFSLSCIRERNGNPLQCSCLENPRDGGSLTGCHLWGRAESDTTEATYGSSSHVSVCVCVCVHACPLSLGYVIGMTTPQEQGLSFIVISPLPCIGPDPGKVPNERKEGDGYEGFE